MRRKGDSSGPFVAIALDPVTAEAIRRLVDNSQPSEFTHGKLLGIDFIQTPPVAGVVPARGTKRRARSRKKKTAKRK